MKTQMLIILLWAAAAAAQPSVLPEATIICDEAAGCTHFYKDGVLFKTITAADGTVVTVGLADNGKYLRLSASVFNGTGASYDVLPDSFQIKFDEKNKEKLLSPIPPEQIAKTAESRAGWANYFSRVGAALAHNTSTTNTTSNSTTQGTVRTNSTDGTYTNGSYSGTTTGSSTSTTTTPDYQARAIAEQRIADRNARVAVANDQMMHTALMSNTLSPGQAIGGYVYFKSIAASGFHPRLLIAGKIYEYNF